MAHQCLLLRAVTFSLVRSRLAPWSRLLAVLLSLHVFTTTSAHAQTTTTDAPATRPQKTKKASAKETVKERADAISRKPVRKARRPAKKPTTVSPDTGENSTETPPPAEATSAEQTPGIEAAPAELTPKSEPAPAAATPSLKQASELQQSAASPTTESSDAPSVAASDAAPVGLGIISGRVAGYLRLPTENTLSAPIHQASSSIWLQARPKLSDAAYAKMVLSLDALQTSVVLSETLRAQIREAYVGYSKGGWDFRLGRQIIPWGNADGVNPTDLLTSKDLAFFSSDSEVKRVGSLSVALSWTPAGGDSPVQFTVVAVPAFTSSRLIIPPGSIPDAVVDEGLDRPETSIRNAEFAGRMVYRGQQWDASLMGFSGWNHTPEFVARTYDASGVYVYTTHRRYRAIGGDASASFGSWIFRFESAYVWTDSANGQNPRRQPPHWDSVFGIEHPFSETFRASTQFVLRYHPTLRPITDISYADPVRTQIVQQLTSLNALLLNFQSQTRPALTLRLAYATEDEKFEAEIVGMFNLARIGEKRADKESPYDYFVRPLLTYRFTDELRMHCGLEYYGGPSDGSFGALHALSAGFVEAIYAF